MKIFSTAFKCLDGIKEFFFRSNRKKNWVVKSEDDGHLIYFPVEFAKEVARIYKNVPLDEAISINTSNKLHGEDDSVNY